MSSSEAASSGHRTARRHRNHRSSDTSGSGTRVHRWSQRSQILLGALSLSVVIIFFLILFFSIKFYSLSRENAELTRSMREAQRELEPLRKEVVQLREDLKALVEKRLPRMMPLEFDKVIALDERYVKNISFTLMKKDQEQSYEYKIVLQNDSLSTVEPDLRVYLFNRSGLQVGMSQIRGDASMGLGEVRSYTRVIETEPEEEPAYFMVRLTKEKEIRF